VRAGSSHLQLGMVDREIHGAGVFGTYRDAVLPGVHVIEGGQTSTGSILNWFRRAGIRVWVGEGWMDDRIGKRGRRWGTTS
jgi:ribulose kinase